MKMSSSVTGRAERDEILFGIIPQPAAGVEVVDLKISRYSAFLAAPPIAREHLRESSRYDAHCRGSEHRSISLSLQDVERDGRRVR
jgi:hypothetical protein